jgi:hypothetical protein
MANGPNYGPFRSNKHAFSGPNSPAKNPQVIEKIGGASRDRTDDLIVANDALSQLSYSPTALWMVDRVFHFISVARSAQKEWLPGGSV